MYPIEAASSPRRWTTGLRIVTLVVLDCFIAKIGNDAEYLKSRRERNGNNCTEKLEREII